MEERIYDITITLEDGNVEEVTIVTLPKFLHSTIDCIEAEYDNVTMIDIEEVPV